MREITVCPNEALGKNTRFWEAAGSDLLFHSTLKAEGQALLDRMQEHKSCRYLRNHYTFNSIVRWGRQIGLEVYKEDENGKPIYNFDKVNKVFSEYVKRGIKPIVEFDYIPDELSTEKMKDIVQLAEGLKIKTTPPTDWQKWENLIIEFTKNLAATFGLDEIRKWYFEVWNEPDNWPYEDIGSFFKIYDVFAHAVKSVDEKLKVGGPATHTTYFLKPFLEHVSNGTNHVTGQRGSPIDFISHHIYGLSGNWVHKHPLVRPIVQSFVQELMLIGRSISKYPALKNCEFHLNEWGVCSNFFRTAYDYPALEYRNSEFSALFLAKLVDSIFSIKDNFAFDVSMLLYWGFCMEAEEGKLFMGIRDLTTAGNVPKPIQTAHEMLSRLYDERISVKGCTAGENISAIATKNSDGDLSLIIYNFDELSEENGYDDITLSFDRLDCKKASVSGMFLDKGRHNTYRSWQSMGSPQQPTEEVVKKLMDTAKLDNDFCKNIKIKNGQGKIKLRLPKHSMCLINFERIV